MDLQLEKMIYFKNRDTFEALPIIEFIISCLLLEEIEAPPVAVEELRLKKNVR